MSVKWSAQLGARMHKPTEINNNSRLREQQRDIEKKHRRKVHEGYPRRAKLSLSEAAAYLRQDTIDCLICGRRLKSLSAHLARIHRISTDDYKMRFGLPFRAGLTCTSMTEKLKAVRSMDSLRTIESRLARLRKARPAANIAARAQRTSGVKTLWALRNSATALPTPRKYDRRDAETVLDALEAGAMLYPYLRDAGTMSATTFKVLIRENVDLFERYRTIAGAARRLALAGNDYATRAKSKRT